MTRMTAAVLALPFLTAPVLAADYGAPAPQQMLYEDQGLRGTIGIRYWYSKANSSIDAGGTNLIKSDNVTGQSGEILFRLDDPDQGAFIKGNGGFGRNTSGSNSILGVKASSFEASSFGYVTLDAGWQVSEFAGDSARLGAFLGYHYLTDKFSGTYSGTTLTRDASWHAIRLGLSADGSITDRVGWSVDMAAIPWAYNKTGSVDSTYTYGAEADAMIDVSLTQNWALGLGGRYWWLHSNYDDPDAEQDYHRYGLLVESKYSF
ncbi:hypothetical protein [Roseibium litorale]|uniref:Porin n=1 Tax=Roseibium litorale TaxID=2803841 RepID=A0ABR9CTH7_9HYPH|nr:hypothetical protein [Roseibium litorale]MBD8894155.1 hypothetical protein [Roseibium litorale]